MYLSRLKLDISRRETMMAMASPNRFHGNIESSFGDRKRRLWRIDYLNGEYYLLLLSETIPDLMSLQEQFGMLEEPGESRDYQPLLDRIEKDSMWHFRVVANPTRSVKLQNDRSRGKVLSEVSEEQMIKWLYRKAEKNGFSIVPGDSLLRQVKWFSFRKGISRHYVRFKAASYEGVLKVENPILLREALINGIGREKAYGMGLLTIAQ